jgi:hypothetical protein
MPRCAAGFQKSGGLWVNATALAPGKSAQSKSAPFGVPVRLRFKNSLMGDDVVEDKILSSRLAFFESLDFVSWEFQRPSASHSKS